MMTDNAVHSPKKFKFVPLMKILPSKPTSDNNSVTYMGIHKLLGVNKLMPGVFDVIPQTRHEVIGVVGRTVQQFREADGILTRSPGGADVGDRTEVTATHHDGLVVESCKHILHL